MLASLTPREGVLRMRFGIGMNTDHTLEVSQRFSRREYRQIRRRRSAAQHPSRSRKLRSSSTAEDALPWARSSERKPTKWDVVPPDRGGRL
jgi:hypothetical protein